MEVSWLKFIMPTTKSSFRGPYYCSSMNLHFPSLTFPWSRTLRTWSQGLWCRSFRRREAGKAEAWTPPWSICLLTSPWQRSRCLCSRSCDSRPAWQIWSRDPWSRNQMFLSLKRQARRVLSRLIRSSWSSRTFLLGNAGRIERGRWLLSTWCQP